MEIVQGKVTIPIDEARKKKFKKDDITNMSIIVDSIKDHIIPYISKHDTSNKMYGTLNKLYTINNIGQIMNLRKELCDIRMTRNNIVASYFVRDSQLRDQLQVIDEIVSDKELVTSTLNELPCSWDSFAAGISSGKEAPILEDLWAAYVQEEYSRLLSMERNKKEEKYSQAYEARSMKVGGRKKYGFQKKK